MDENSKQNIASVIPHYAEVRITNDKPTLFGERRLCDFMR